MNGIVFGEGRNDVDFIIEAISKASGFYPLQFIAEEIAPEDRRPRESQKIRDLITIHSDDAILVKSEQGKPELKETIVSFLNELVKKPAFFSLIIDLDGADFRELISELDSMTVERYDAYSEITMIEEPVHKSDFIRFRCQVTLSGAFTDTFGIIAFHDSLEDAVGIHDEDSRESCREKIREYYQEDPELNDLVIGSIL